MLIKHLTEARKGRQNSSACSEARKGRENSADRGPQGRDNRTRSAINLRPEDGYLQLVITIITSKLDISNISACLKDMARSMVVSTGRNLCSYLCCVMEIT